MQVDEHRVRGENQSAEPRALRRDEEIGKHQGHCADEQVGVNGEERAVGPDIEESRQRPVAAALFQLAGREQQCERKGRVLCDHRCQRNTVDLHAEHDDEQQVQNDVGQVDRQEYEQRHARVLQTQEPADHDVVGERARRAPYANRVVDLRRCLYIRVAADEHECQPAERDLQHEQQERDQQRDDERLAQRHADSVVVVGAIALRRNSRRSHAQEVHTGIEKAEDRGADGDSAEVCCVLEMSDDAGVDHAEQRHRNVGQDHRRGDTPDCPVGGNHPNALMPVSSLPTTSW